MDQELSLGAVLQARREALGLLTEDVCRAVGVHHATIYRYEQNERRPSAAMLEKLAAALRLPTSDLMALAGYTVQSQLPGIRPYLRTKYGLDDASIQEISEYIRSKASTYGDLGYGPFDGEDELAS